MGSMNVYKFFYSNNYPARPKGHGEKQQVEKHNPGRVVKANETWSEKEIVNITTGFPCSYSSSLTYNSRLSQTGILPSRTSIAVKEKQQTQSKSMQSSNIRDTVRDSMYREARSVPIRSRNTEEMPETSIMKYTDSPRPLQPSELRKTESMVQEVLAPTRLSKDEWLSLPRLSFDKLESRESMKPKELPRLSLDSRTTAIRNSLESRKNPSNQEHGAQKRLSSVIAKLMGLDILPDSNPTPEVCHTTKVNQNKSKNIAFITSERKKNCEASPQLNRGGNLNVTMETAPWKQKDHGKSSPRIEPRSSKPTAHELDQSLRVDLEATRKTEESELGYGKELRSLKQVLESLQQISRGSQHKNVDCSKPQHRRHRSEEICSYQKPNLSTWQNKTYEKDGTARRTRSYKSLSHHAEKSLALMNEKMNAHDHKNHRKNSTTEGKNRDAIPWKGAWRNSVAEPTSRTRSASGKVSPRAQLNALKAQDDSPRSTLSMKLGRDTQHSRDKSAEKSSTRRKKQSHTTSSQLNYDQLSELSSDTRYSSNQGDTTSTKSDGNTCDTSQTETIDTSILVGSIDTYPREHLKCLKSLADFSASIKLATNIMEQPSPVSVLDNSFYNEEVPSPIAKISTYFQEEDTTSPKKGWYTVNPLHNEARFQDESRFNFENHPTNFRSKSDDQMNEAKLLSRHPEHTLTSGMPREVLCSQLLSDSNCIFGRKNVAGTEHEMLSRDEMFTSRRKSTNLETLMKEISMENRSILLDHGMMKSMNAEKTHEPEDWKDLDGEIPRLVLDIERQIFKDLVTEVISACPIPLEKLKRARRFPKVPIT